MENHLIYYLETYTFSEIIAQATIFTVLVVVLHHFFEIFPCFHYQTVLITDAKVIYYIDTAIRANGDLHLELTNDGCVINFCFLLIFHLLPFFNRQQR